MLEREDDEDFNENNESEEVNDEINEQIKFSKKRFGNKHKSHKLKEE